MRTLTLSIMRRRLKRSRPEARRAATIHCPYHLSEQRRCIKLGAICHARGGSIQTGPCACHVAHYRPENIIISEKIQLKGKVLSSVRRTSQQAQLRGEKMNDKACSRHCLGVVQRELGGEWHREREAWRASASESLRRTHQLVPSHVSCQEEFGAFTDEQHIKPERY